MGGGGTIKIFCQNFLSHIAEIFPRSESFSVSLLQGIEKVWIRDKRGGGSIRFSRRTFLSHSAKVFHLVGVCFSV